MIPEKSRRCNGAIVLLMAGVFLGGCASMREACKKAWGSSIAHLESARAQGKSREVSLSQAEAFAVVSDALKKSGAQVYLKDRRQRYLAAMGFVGHVDTTQAGVFFDPLPQGGTRVEVSSLSRLLTAEVSAIVFAALEPAPQSSAAGEVLPSPPTAAPGEVPKSFDEEQISQSEAVGQAAAAQEE